MGERAGNEASQRKLKTSPVLGLIGLAVWLLKIGSDFKTPKNCLLKLNIDARAILLCNRNWEATQRLRHYFRKRRD
jgi:hypothetical protein